MWSNYSSYFKHFHPNTPELNCCRRAAAVGAGAAATGGDGGATGLVTGSTFSVSI